MLTISKHYWQDRRGLTCARSLVSESRLLEPWTRRCIASGREGFAQEWGLRDSVGAEELLDLSEGQHPESRAQLVKAPALQRPTTTSTAGITASNIAPGGRRILSAEIHFLSPRFFVGGDERVRQAHRESVRMATWRIWSGIAQARIGNIHAPEDDSQVYRRHTSSMTLPARWDGYAAPQLHTHAVIFNMNRARERPDAGASGASLFQSQQYATSVYRSELATRLQGIGYEIERGSMASRNQGYTQEYLDASSPRREQIKSHLQQIGEKARARPRLRLTHARQQADSFSGRVLQHTAN